MQSTLLIPESFLTEKSPEEQKASGRRMTMNKKQKNILSAIFLGILLLFTCLFILAVALQAYYKLYGVPNQFFAWLKDIDTDDLQTSYVNWEKK